jgi:Fur family zinc uptake transcriptional regulator
VAMSKLKEPQGAYKILAELSKKRIPKLSAMSLYRTLDFLIELGVVVKYDSQNIYKLCTGHDHDHSHLLMVCDQCGNAREVEDCSAEQKLQSLARKHGHTLKHNVIELHGLCASCDA